MRQHAILLALAVLGFLALSACDDQTPGGTADDSGWSLLDTGGGDAPAVGSDSGRDTNPPPPPKADTGGWTGPDAQPDAASCPDDVQPRDGTCDKRCSHVDPDCAMCPDPDDPDVEYVGGSYEEPTKCRLLDFGCEPGWEGFGSELCGCGCRRESGGNSGGLCGAMDASGEGLCDAIIGVKFNGSTCVSMSGCSCQGPDCSRVYRSIDECERATGDCDKKCGDPESSICDIYQAIEPRECPSGTVYTVKDCEPMCVDPMTCNEPKGTTCGPNKRCARSEWCDYPTTACGGDGGSGTCKERPRACPENYSPVCGCDGQTYGNECMAHSAGVDIRSRGECD